MTGRLLESTLLAVIYLGFLLAARGAFRDKIDLLFPRKLLAVMRSACFNGCARAPRTISACRR